MCIEVIYKLWKYSLPFETSLINSHRPNVSFLRQYIFSGFDGLFSLIYVYPQH